MTETFSVLNFIEGVPNDNIEDSTIKQLIEPLNLLIQKKVSRCYLSVLSIFQTLFASSLLLFEQKIAFLELSLILLKTKDDMILIKIMQILLIMMDRSDIVKLPMANNILALSLKSFSIKNQMIKNNVFAVLGQMYSLLFEEYAIEAQRGNIREESKLHKVCYEQLEKVVSITNSKTKHTNLKGLGMDI